MGTPVDAHLAVVTGASRGIGAAIAQVLVANGFQVALLARDEAALAGLETKLGERARSFRCDVAHEDSVNATLDRIESSMGLPGVIVNNAGLGGPFHRVDEVDQAEWDALFGVNVEGVRHMCRWALPRMKASGYGRIVNIASLLGLFGGARSSTYAATKHALVGFSKSIAAEWASAGITCNAVCPGYIDTEMLAKADPESRESLLRRIPAGRFGSAEEVARLVAFLVGPFGGYINGSTLVMDGGLSAHVANEVIGF